MGVLRWLNTFKFSASRMGLSTHFMAYRVRSALIRTVPWLQIRRPLQQLPTRQVGGQLGKRTPNADLWRTQKLRRYEKPLTNIGKMDADWTTSAIGNRRMLAAQKPNLKEASQVREALESRCFNYRHLSQKR